jgi:hypothetical protein
MFAINEIIPMEQVVIRELNLHSETMRKKRRSLFSKEKETFKEYKVIYYLYTACYMSQPKRTRERKAI